MAIDRFSILIDDPKIGELAGVQQDRFWLKFQADPADSGKDRARLDSFPRNQALIPPFNYRKLHLRFLIDQSQKLTKSKSSWEWIIHWRGENIAGAITNRRVAKYIGLTYFGEYRRDNKVLDVYITTEEESKELISIE